MWIELGQNFGAELLDCDVTTSEISALQWRENGFGLFAVGVDEKHSHRTGGS